jgi:hypothetical protein
VIPFRITERPPSTTNPSGSMSETARLFQGGVAGGLVARSQRRLRPLDRQRSRRALGPALGLLSGSGLTLLLSLRIILRRRDGRACPFQRRKRAIFADARRQPRSPLLLRVRGRMLPQLLPG